MRYLPALNFSRSGIGHNQLIARFLGQVIRTLDRLKHLVLSPNTPVDMLLRHSGSKLQSISSLTVGDLSNLSWLRFPYFGNLETSLGFASLGPLDFIQYLYNEDEFNVILIGDGCADETFNTVMTFCKSLSLHPCVHMFPHSGSNVNLSFVLRDNMKKLCVINKQYCSVTCLGNIPNCSNLTELHLVKMRSADHDNGIDWRATYGLSSAIKEGKLPELTHLNFDSSKFSEIHSRNVLSLVYSFSSFSFLSECKWSTLTHLSLLNSEIQWNDNEHFCKALSQGFFSQLKSLKICGRIGDLFNNEWTKLQSLILQNIADGNEVLAIFQKLYFPNLIELGLVQQWHYLNLSKISSTVPRLECLTINNFSCSVDELPCTQFEWQLSKLDLSYCLSQPSVTSYSNSERLWALSKGSYQPSRSPNKAITPRVKASRHFYEQTVWGTIRQSV